MRVVFQFAEKTFDRIDTLVLNHAIVADLEQWKNGPSALEDLRTLFDVNFFAYVSAVDHATPFLEKSGGSVIIVSSINGQSVKFISLITNKIIPKKKMFVKIHVIYK